VTRLGAGAMGQVYLARSAAGRLVAIKTIKPELAEEEGFRTRFAQEVAAARRVSGFFTAAVVEADPDADVPWLATAYVPAPSLRRMVQACGPLPPLTVRWLAAGCAEALESIHAVGLIHMDLKPSNVLVADDGPRVIDFGVARAAGRIGTAPAGYDPQHGPIGTPAYMAPEQARDIRLASPASDVFSLGATLLYAATGHPPYGGETTADVLIRLANELPDLTDLPAELTGLVTSCLDRDPNRRPSSATVLARVGQFTEDQSYLPVSAHALIGQYQPGRVGDTDETAPSIPALPDKARPEASPLNSWPALPALRGLIPRSWRRRFRPPAWAGWSVAGAALIAAGVILGATLTSSGVTALPAPTHSAVAGTGTSNSGTGTGDSGTGNTGTGTGNSGAGGSGAGNQGSGVTPTLEQLDEMTGPRCGPALKTRPVLCVNTQVGVPTDKFTVTTIGFPAHTRVSLTMTYYPPPSSASSPSVWRTFSMSASGTKRLGAFSEPGKYQIAVTTRDGDVITAAFAIVPVMPPS
jgi:serine/threonine protein kinase